MVEHDRRTVGVQVEAAEQGDWLSALRCSRISSRSSLRYLDLLEDAGPQTHDVLAATPVLELDVDGCASLGYRHVEWRPS